MTDEVITTNQPEYKVITQPTLVSKPRISQQQQQPAKITILGSVSDSDWLVCSITGCSFWTRKPERMARHERCHVNQFSKHFKCPDCGKKFLSLPKMLKHDRLVHTGVKDYECRLCGAEVTDISIHMRVRLKHTLMDVRSRH